MRRLFRWARHAGLGDRRACRPDADERHLRLVGKGHDRHRDRRVEPTEECGDFFGGLDTPVSEIAVPAAQTPMNGTLDWLEKGTIATETGVSSPPKNAATFSVGSTRRSR